MKRMRSINSYLFPYHEELYQRPKIVQLKSRKKPVSLNHFEDTEEYPRLEFRTQQMHFYEELLGHECEEAVDREFKGEQGDSDREEN